MPAPHARRKGPDDMRRALLDWYDRHGRDLPWRAKGGQRPNPYYVWLSEVMLQQTTVQAVIPYFVKFVDNWPTIHNLAAAPDEEVMQAWAGLGYYARARNLLKCARAVVVDFGGVFPSDISVLKTLPGIGDYTAAAISAIAFDRVATVIDGNVDRVISRYCAIEDPLPGSKSDIRRHADLYFQQDLRPGDFAQSMMDLGATVCVPQNPRCGVCPIQDGCLGLAKGIAASLPRKDPKTARPVRMGFVYCFFNNAGEILLERRPDSGLLGGMMALPTSDWVDTRFGHPDHSFDIEQFNTVFMDKDFQIRHVFTHFTLILQGVTIRHVEPNHPVANNRQWTPLSSHGLPTVFRKVISFIEAGERKR